MITTPTTYYGIFILHLDFDPKVPLLSKGRSLPLKVIRCALGAGANAGVRTRKRKRKRKGVVWHGPKKEAGWGE